MSQVEFRSQGYTLHVLPETSYSDLSTLLFSSSQKFLPPPRLTSLPVSLYKEHRLVDPSPRTKILKVLFLESTGVNEGHYLAKEEP